MCQNYFIRPHHMLCLQFFEGKGYSSEFVKNMMNVKNELESNNPVVNIVSGADMICEKCPNREGTVCKNEESVKENDKRVYAQVKEYIENANEVSWQKITAAIHDRIIDSGKMPGICGECRWAHICLKDCDYNE